MRIAIVGTGMVGKTIVKTLSLAGHDLNVANSRGPEAVPAEMLSWRTRAATIEEAMKEVDVIILSIPLDRIPSIAHHFASVPQETVVIDTSNYQPYRDNTTQAIEDGQVESQWVSQQLGRPIAKAWNAIGWASFAKKGKPKGATGRIAVPVAADLDHDRSVAMMLVEDSGFDAFDAGPLAESWRQQPGAPAYCTDLTLDEMRPALAAAEKDRLPKRRDLIGALFQERYGDKVLTIGMDWDHLVKLARAVQM